MPQYIKKYNKKPLSLPPTGGNDMFTLEDRVAALPNGQGLGHYTNGENIPFSTCTTLQDVLDLLCISTLYPSFGDPYIQSVNLNGIGLQSTVEVGTTIGNFIATVAFNYGSIIPLYPAVPVPNPSNGPRVGSVTSYAFSGIIANTSGLASTSPQQTVVATSGNNTVNVTVSFGQGPQPRNSTGAITDVNNVNYTPYAAGSMNSSASFEGKYKIFYGPSLTDHVSGTGDARSLSSFFVSGTTFNMFPGITATSFYVYIPVSSGLSLTNVVASTFENLTVYYVLVTSSFQILDAGGNLVTYKKYKMTNAIPYTNPALYHTITISIA